MELSGEEIIPASRDFVWKALNDPEILRQSLPGCESLTKIDDHNYEAVVTAKIGPIAARFKGKVNLSDIVAPESYKLSGEGQGGAAGFGKGAARVTLHSEGHHTRLTYQVEAQVGGKIAQLGARLVNAAAQKIAEDFFMRFNAAVTAASGQEVSLDSRKSDSSIARSLSPAVWIPGLIFLAAILTWLILR